MNNPFLSPAEAEEGRDRSPPVKSALHFVLAGLSVGSAAGITNLFALIAVFAIEEPRGWGDFYRSPAWLPNSVLTMAIGGAVIGAPYGLALYLVFRRLRAAFRPAPHFCVGVVSAAIISFVAGYSLNYEITIGLIVLGTFAGAVSTAKWTHHRK